LCQTFPFTAFLLTNLTILWIFNRKIEIEAYFWAKTMGIADKLFKMKSDKSEANLKAGQEFLAKNKQKPGVTETASGLQYEVITEGTGPKPTPYNSVTCHYHGTLIDGTIFDSSVQRANRLLSR
jgi:FKBP-type peptidyl-prolyl cis-trans isomerase